MAHFNNNNQQHKSIKKQTKKSEKMSVYICNDGSVKSESKMMEEFIKSIDMIKEYELFKKAIIIKEILED